MNLRNIALTASIVALSGVLLLAGRFWESKPYQEWNEREALSLLRDSPWSQTQLIKMVVQSSGGGAARHPTLAEGSSGRAVTTPGGSYGGAASEPLTRTTAAFSASFISAKPVRMALARLGMLNGSVDPAAARQLVEDSPFADLIAISLAVESSQEMIDLDALSTGDLQDATFLELKQSKRRITLQEYVPPSQSGNGLPLFLFPRSEDGRPLVTLAEKQVKFISRLSEDLKVEQKFKLKRMVFDGQLEI